MLKLAKEQIAEHLCFIYNLSFTTGIFPDSLKIAKVTPVYKKGSKLECANYRPITLLSNLDKIIEKLMHKRLMGFLNDQKVLYKKQFGFQKKISTAHAVISLIENIEKAIDNKIFVCRVFVDLQKAFDTVDHNILLHKLSHYGIRDIANCWFSSYLSNRKQFVTINGFDSVIQSFQYGVPQGSVLGPLLFLIYINDLHNAIKFSQSFHFADDTCLLNIQNTISKINRSLNKDLKELSFWLNANKIALNVAKTEVILFKTKHKPCYTDLRLKLCRKRLYKTKYLRYLGIKMM